MGTPSLYLILGAPDSGRREVVHDILEDGFGPDARIAYWHCVREATADADALIAAMEHVRVATYETIENLPDPDDDTAGWLIMAEGAANPVDQVEAFKAWLDHHGLEPTRLITVVNCALLHAHQKLRPWFRACIHFSDIVLLNRRENVPNQWFSDFQTEYKREHFPCLFEWVKKGRVENPARILYPEIRRMSHLFDDLDAVDSLELDGDDPPREGFDLTRAADPYLDKLPGGARKKRLPDIREFIDD